MPWVGGRWMGDGRRSGVPEDAELAGGRTAAESSQGQDTTRTTQQKPENGEATLPKMQKAS